MSSAAENPYANFGMQMAAHAPADERVAFLKRVYLHVAGAVYALVALEWALLTLVPDAVMQRVVGTMIGGYGWLLVLGAFMAVSFVAQRLAESGASAGKQYLGLSLYVVAQAVILLPLLWYANQVAPGSILTAAVLTTLIFAGLTAAVLLTRKDFSFMGPILGIVAMGALGLIVISIISGGAISLGMWFSVAMCVLMGGYILYYTSYVLHHCRTDQHVAASLLLFSAIATLFWYILQLVMSRD